jgi:electron transfer flavoprotein alpha subunit
MSILVFVESAEGKIKKTSIEAICYAHAMGGAVTAIVLGLAEKAELESLGKYGAQKVLHAADEKLNQGIIQAYAAVLASAMADEKADVLILANSSLGTPVAARLATKYLYR